MTQFDRSPTSLLLRIVTVHFHEYRPEVIEDARRVLRGRADLLEPRLIRPLSSADRLELDQATSRELGATGVMLLLVFAVSLFGTGVFVLSNPRFADRTTGLILTALGALVGTISVRMHRQMRNEQQRAEALSIRAEEALTPDLADPEIRDHILAWLDGRLEPARYESWLQGRSPTAPGDMTPPN